MLKEGPPLFATWLLKHLGCNADVDAVLGDLAERYQQGKTSVWYWRQVVVAIVVSAFKDIRDHKALTLRSLIIGWPIFWYLGYWAFGFLGHLTTRWSPEWFYSAVGLERSWNHDRFVAFYWYFENAVGSILMLTIGMVPGWIVARLNPRHRRSTILLFSLSVLLSWIYYRWTATPEDIGGSLYWESYFWMNTILQVGGVIAGGLLKFPARHRPKGSMKFVQSAPWQGLLGVIYVMILAQVHPLASQDGPLGTIQGTVTIEGGTEPLPDVAIIVVAKGSLAASGFTAQQVLNAVARGAAVNPELVQRAQDATRGGPQGALATAAPLTAVSDRAGRFTVRNVVAGDYFVRAQLQNYFGPSVNGTRGPIATTNAAVTRQQTTEVHLSLIRGGAIGGRILDPNGKPLQNARVQALQTAYDDGIPVLRIADQKPTDDRGEFRLGILAPAEYYLAVIPAVGTKAAEPASEVTVTTFYPGAIDMSTAAPIVLRGSEDLSGMSIQLKTAPGAKISGRVTTTLPSGPAPGGRGGTRPLVANLALAPRYKAGFSDFSGGGAVIAANADGVFEIPNVPPGSYDVFARLPVANGWGALAPPERATAPWALGRTSVEVRGGNVDDVTILVHQGADVKGRVTVDGKPAAANIRLSLVPDDSATRVNENQISQVFGQIAQYQTKIEQDGSFTIPVIPEGHYRFQIAFIGTAAATSYVVDIRQGGISVYDNGLTLGTESNPVELAVNTNGGSIEGTVLGADRKPIPNTMVVAVPAAARRQNPALYKTVQTDAQGRFAMTGIAPGLWKLFAWESVQAGAYQNAEFIRRFEERGTSVAAASGVRANVDVTLIKD